MGQSGQLCHRCDDDYPSGGDSAHWRAHRIRTAQDVDRLRVQSYCSTAASSVDFLGEADEEAVSRSHSSRSQESSRSVVSMHCTNSVVVAFKNALRSNNDSLVVFYLNEYPLLDLLRIPFEDGDRCLHFTARHKRHKLAEKLLEHGASPNDSNPMTGDTALHLATSLGDETMVRLLMDHGADPLRENKNQQSPLMIAARIDHRTLGVSKITSLLDVDGQCIPLALYTDRLRESNDTLTVPEEGGGRFLGDSDDSEAVEAVTEYVLSNDTAETVQLHSTQSAEKEDVADIDRLDTARLDDLAEQILRPGEEAEVAEDADFVSSPIAGSECEAVDGDDIVDAVDAEQDSDRSPCSPLKRSECINIASPRHSNTFLQRVIGDEALPALSSWMEKKNLYRWQSRYVLVEGAYILWNDRVALIEDPSDELQRNAFKNWARIADISDIVAVAEGSGQNKFAFTVRDGKRTKQYLWKCPSERERAFWVDGLRKHRAFHTRDVC